MVEFNHTNKEPPSLSYNATPFSGHTTLNLSQQYTISGRLDHFTRRPKTAYEKIRDYINDNIVYREYSAKAVVVAFLLGAFLF